MNKKYFILVTLIVIFLPVIGRAQFVELTYIASHEEVLRSQSFCFHISESTRGKQCYRLTDFPTLEITKQGVLPENIVQKVASSLAQFAWMEISDFALADIDLATKETKVVPFVVRLRWRPKEVSLPGVEVSHRPRGVVFAFGLIYLNEFESGAEKRIEMDHYGIQGEFPRFSQGLAAQQDAYVFHHNNLVWLQNILEPILGEYLRSSEKENPRLP